MIHNWEKEGNRTGQKRPDNVSGYLNDEELLRLIGEVEAKQMLHAPVHLKEEVFARLTAQRQAVRHRQTFSYRAKVLVGMAAALAMLVMIPAGDIDRESVPVAQIFDIGQEEQQEPLQKIERERQKDTEDEWKSYLESKERRKLRREFKEDVGKWLSSWGNILRDGDDDETDESRISAE